jgi:hypothetical protein
VWAPRVGSVGGGSGTNGHTGGWVSGGRSLRIRGGSVTGALPTIRGMRPPTQHLLEALARHRRAGDPFEDAWAPAVLSVVSQISDTDESVPVAWRVRGDPERVGKLVRAPTGNPG